MASKKPQTITAAVRRGAAGMPKLPAQFTPPGPDMQPAAPGDSPMHFPPPPMAMLPTESPATSSKGIVGLDGVTRTPAELAKLRSLRGRIEKAHASDARDVRGGMVLGPLSERPAAATKPSAPKKAHWTDKYFKAGVW